MDKELVRIPRRDLLFLIKSLEKFPPFDSEEVPEWLSPEFYQTLSHEGDNHLKKKFKRIKERLETGLYEIP